jgi:hypothetical protein
MWMVYTSCECIVDQCQRGNPMYDEYGHFFTKVDVGCSSLLKIFLCKYSKANEKLLHDNRQILHHMFIIVTPHCMKAK